MYFRQLLGSHTRQRVLRIQGLYTITEICSIIEMSKVRLKIHTDPKSCGFIQYLMPSASYSCFITSIWRMQTPTSYFQTIFRNSLIRTKSRGWTHYVMKYNKSGFFLRWCWHFSRAEGNIGWPWTPWKLLVVWITGWWTSQVPLLSSYICLCWFPQSTWKQEAQCSAFIQEAKKKKEHRDHDQLQDHIVMLFKLTILHRNLDSAVDMADRERSVRSAMFEMPIYNKTDKVKYLIGPSTSQPLPQEY